MKNVSAVIISAIFAIGLAACSSGGSVPSTSAPMSALPQLPAATTSTQTGAHAISPLAKQIASTATNLHYHIFPRPGLRKFPNVSYPLDLQNHGGATQGTAVEHNVYLTIVTTPSTTATPAPASYWGNPDQFLTNANAAMTTSTSLLHVTDQYVASTASNRYQHGTDWSIVEYVPTNTSGVVVLNESQMISAAVDAALNLGTKFGLGQEYHVFLQQGIDQCFDQAADCYSPDNVSAWTFCAWHGSANLGTTYGTLIFSVEPWQGTTGSKAGSCGSSATATDLQNSTASTLSHEMIETITDPVHAWWNNFTGNEIADNCTSFNATYSLNGVSYVLQKEYSNKQHGCI